MAELIADTVTRTFVWPGGSAPCAIGRSGAIATAAKREGDGMTPRGRYPLRWVYAQPGRIEALTTGLAVRWLDRADGWCDDPADPAYNRPVRLPYPASAESLWRVDGLYDLIVVLGHNDWPVVPGFGSAIFLHCALADATGALKPTAGCVAVPTQALRAALAQCDAHSWIDIR
jgi:L,D-peptidoglycan transpeptidase YkuD (ErfK/YbiS/YcfS/YnhG family)